MRTLAYVTVKRPCGPRAFSANLSASERTAAKGMLLDEAMRAPSKAMRNAVLDVIARVAKWTVPTSGWPELLEFFLGLCVTPPSRPDRALAFKLFESLTETIVNALNHHYNTLGELFKGGLVDGIAEVRVSALRAVGALVANTTGEPEQMTVIKALVPHVLEAAKTAVRDGDDDSAGIVFEVLDELTESRTNALSGQVPEVVSFCIQVATADRELSMEVRRRALDVSSFMARHKPKSLIKSKLIEPMLTVLCPLCGEPKEAELAGEEELDDEEELQIQTVASQLIDILALKVPSKYILPTILSFASTNINNESNERMRHAAVAVLGQRHGGGRRGHPRAARKNHRAERRRSSQRPERARERRRGVHARTIRRTPRSDARRPGHSQASVAEFVSSASGRAGEERSRTHDVRHGRVVGRFPRRRGYIHQTTPRHRVSRAR